MKATATLRVDRQRTYWRDAPPVVLRPTGSTRMHLVHAAGGPLGGDDLRLDTAVGSDCQLQVSSVAATVVQPGPAGGCARWLVDLDLAAGAELRWQPQPTVICAGAGFHGGVRATLDADARLVLREQIVLGRSGEVGGAYRGELSVTVAGRTLLVQENLLDGADAELSGPGGTAGYRVLGTLLVAGRDVVPPPQRFDQADGLRWATLPLDGPGYLVQVLGTSVGQVSRVLDAVLV